MTEFTQDELEAAIRRAVDAELRAEAAQADGSLTETGTVPDSDDLGK